MIKYMRPHRTLSLVMYTMMFDSTVKILNQFRPNIAVPKFLKTCVTDKRPEIQGLAELWAKGSTGRVPTLSGGISTCQTAQLSHEVCLSQACIFQVYPMVHGWTFTTLVAMKWG